MEPADVGSRLQDLVPGTAPITLFLRNAPPDQANYTAYSIYGVRPTARTQNAAEVNGNMVMMIEQTFEFYRPSLQAAGVPTTFSTVANGPRYFDYFVDGAGINWIVQSVEVNDIESYFEVKAIANM